MARSDEGDGASNPDGASQNVVWLRELRPFATILVTAAAGGLTTYCSVDKHAQRVKEQEVTLRNEQFQAEELSKYLALPMREAVSKRAMATYLQALFFSKGELQLHRWATKQIDYVDADTRIRRSILQERAAELAEAKRRRDELIRKRAELEAAASNPSLSKREVMDLEARLKAVAGEIAASTSQLEAMRNGFDEETRLATDLRASALVEAQRIESIARCCDAVRSEAQVATGSVRDVLLHAAETCSGMGRLGHPLVEVADKLKRLVPGGNLSARCFTP